jgi:hypothetical protein
VQSEKENALSLEDFKNRKIVLLGDEAHHYNANTQSQTQLFQSWEKLIEDIHQADLNNILLEFTATLDYENQRTQHMRYPKGYSQTNSGCQWDRLFTRRMPLQGRMQWNLPKM